MPEFGRNGRNVNLPEISVCHILISVARLTDIIHPKPVRCERILDFTASRT